MRIKLKDSHETIGALPFCKHAGLRLLPNVPNIPNCGLVLKLARYRVSRALEASLLWDYTCAIHMAILQLNITLKLHDNNDLHYLNYGLYLSTFSSKSMTCEKIPDFQNTRVIGCTE